MCRIRSANPNLVSFAAVHLEGSSCPSIYTHTFKAASIGVNLRRGDNNIYLKCSSPQQDGYIFNTKWRNWHKYTFRYKTLIEGARNHTFSCIKVRVDVHLYYFSLVDVYNIYYVETTVKNFAEAYRRITIISVAQFFNLFYLLP